MEHKSTEVSHEKEAAQCFNGMPKPAPISRTDDSEAKLENWKSGEVLFKDGPRGNAETPGEVNMEASISPEDVIRAGGFGARDDISSVLPVATDSTDFEASIREARNYEETEGEVNRPGLGWSKESRLE